MTTTMIGLVNNQRMLHATIFADDYAAIFLKTSWHFHCAVEVTATAAA